MNVQRTKKLYQEGMRIKCIDMKDNQAIEPGTLGTVNFVDDMGTIHVTWDNGRTLGIIPGIDNFEIINESIKSYIKETVDIKVNAPLFKKQKIEPQVHNIKYAFKVSDQDFEDLLNDPFKPRDYIEDHIGDMYVNNFNENQSILVYSDRHKDGIIIQSEGFNYPRYQGLLNNVHDVLELSHHDGEYESKRFEKIKVLVVEPNEKPYVAIIDNDLKSLQAMVGGPIELIYLSRSAELICNEEGKLLNLPANRRIGRDILAGRFIIVGNDDSEHFTSLSRKDIDKYMEVYQDPEQISQKELQDSMNIEVIF